MIICISTMSLPIKVNSNTILLTVHTSCYCVLDLLCVSTFGKLIGQEGVSKGKYKSWERKSIGDFYL